MQEGLLSICCLCYNHSKFIEQCITSILNQDYKNIEIIVLDDGSKDNSIEVLNKIQQTTPIKILSQENSGCIGGNFNKLIKEAKGEYITFISCDDNYISNTFLDKINKLQENKNLAFICHSKIQFTDDNNNPIEGTPLKLDELENPTIEQVLDLDYIELGAYYIQGAIYRKDIVDKVGGFDDDMICDDIILRTKIAKYLIEHKEYTFEVLHYPSVNYRRHSNNVSSNSLRQVKGVLEYLERYCPNNPPSDMYIAWIKSCAYYYIDDVHSYIDMFKNSKNYKIYKKTIKEINNYKSFGIPWVVEIGKYKTSGCKTKFLKFFNLKPIKFVKNNKE